MFTVKKWTESIDYWRIWLSAKNVKNYSGISLHYNMLLSITYPPDLNTPPYCALASSGLPIKRYTMLETKA